MMSASTYIRRKCPSVSERPRSAASRLQFNTCSVLVSLSVMGHEQFQSPSELCGVTVVSVSVMAVSRTRLTLVVITFIICSFKI